jgi:hypothetical protein
MAVTIRELTSQVVTLQNEKVTLSDDLAILKKLAASPVREIPRLRTLVEGLEGEKTRLQNETRNLEKETEKWKGELQQANDEKLAEAERCKTTLRDERQRIEVAHDEVTRKHSATMEKMEKESASVRQENGKLQQSLREEQQALTEEKLRSARIIIKLAKGILGFERMVGRPVWTLADVRLRQQLLAVREEARTLRAAVTSEERLNKTTIKMMAADAKKLGKAVDDAQWRTDTLHQAIAALIDQPIAPLAPWEGLSAFALEPSTATSPAADCWVVVPFSTITPPRDAPTAEHACMVLLGATRNTSATELCLRVNQLTRRLAVEPAVRLEAVQWALKHAVRQMEFPPEDPNVQDDVDTPIFHLAVAFAASAASRFASHPTVSPDLRAAIAGIRAESLTRVGE